MKSALKINLPLLHVALRASHFVLLLFCFCSPAFAQGTAFTYNGRLANGGQSADGYYDFQFRVYDTAPIGSGISLGSPTQIGFTALGVTNGLFTVVLNFGNSPFATGAPRWLEIGVRTNGSGSFTILNPRQAFTATPYAITASNLTGVVSSTGLGGTYSKVVTFSDPGNSFTGNGAGLLNVNASTLSGYTACGLPCYWNLSGNFGTSPTDFLGTTDFQTLRLKVNGMTALEIRPAPTAPNIVAGSDWVDPTVIHPLASGIVIAGGNAPSGVFFSGAMRAYDDDGTIGGGFANSVGTAGPSEIDGAFATVSGGAMNTAAAFGATVAGGVRNYAGGANAFVGGGMTNQSIGAYSVVAGGYLNDSQGDYAFVGGGSNNIIRGVADNSVVTGGAGNLIETNSFNSTIGGGEQNTISFSTVNATIGGGSFNVSAGFASVIAGGRSNIVSGYAATIGGGDANFSSGLRSVVAGGYTNQAIGDFSAVSGGFSNTCYGKFSIIAGGAENFCLTDYGTIAGGRSNFIDGDYSFAAGKQAFCTNIGAFVWSDTQSDPFYSSLDDSFNVRARGGLRLNTDTALVFGDTGASRLLWEQGGSIELGDTSAASGTPFIDFHFGMGASPTDYNVRIINDDDNQLSIFAIGSGTPMARLNGSGLQVNGSLCCSSDRDRKENIRCVDPSDVLAKVAALPLSKWNYKDDSITHIGPMAQDFYAAFAVGPDDKHIATVDADGVALAAIQALNQKLQEKDTAIEALQRRLDRLEALLSGPGQPSR